MRLPRQVAGVPFLVALFASGCSQKDSQSASVPADRISEIAAALDAAPSVCSPGDVAYGTKAAREECVRNAEKTAGNAPEPFPDDLYVGYWQSGERKRFETWRKRMVERFDTLCAAEDIERRGRFLPDIAACLDAFSGWRSWTLPAYDRSIKDPGDKTILIDLLSSDLARRLSECLLRLGGELPPQTVERIRAEIKRRVFDPYLAVAGTVTRSSGWRRGNWWFDASNNWNAVCHSECVRAALAGINDRVTRARFVEAAERAIPDYLGGISSDGYCSEGMAYWNYGFGHYLSMGLSVRRATGGRVDLLANPRARTAMRFPFAFQLERGHSPRFADGCNDPKDCVLRWGCGVWPEYAPLLKGALPMRDAFPVGQVWIARLKPGAAHKFAMAFKGGHNDEMHNHNDIGSWTLMLDGVEMAGDPGNEIYTRRTFSKRRYESPVLNSFGHPVPRVDGKLQGTGRSYAARVVSTVFDDDRDVITLDLTEAYDCPSLCSLVRTMTFDRTACSVQIADKVVFSKPCAFDSPIITYGDVDTKDGNSAFVLSRGKRRMRRLDVSVSGFGGRWRLRNEEIQNPGRPSPRRISASFEQPVASGEVIWTFSVIRRRVERDCQADGTGPVPAPIITWRSAEEYPLPITMIF